MSGDFVTGQEILEGKFNCPRCGYHPTQDDHCWTWNAKADLPIFHCPQCGVSTALEKVADPN